MKEYSALTPIVEKYREYKKAKTDVEEASEMLNEPLYATISGRWLRRN